MKIRRCTMLRAESAVNEMVTASKHNLFKVYAFDALDYDSRVCIVSNTRGETKSYRMNCLNSKSAVELAKAIRVVVFKNYGSKARFMRCPSGYEFSINWPQKKDSEM